MADTIEVVDRRERISFSFADAIETMRRQLSAELGPHGIRVVTLASGGVLID